VTERSSYVTRAIAEEMHSICRHFPSVSSCVGRCGEEGGDKCGVVMPGQVRADQSSSLVGIGQASPPKRSRNVRTEKYDDRPASRLPAAAGKVVVQINTKKDAEGDYEAVRNLHDSGDEGVDAEAFDNENAKIGDAAVWVVCKRSQ